MDQQRIAALARRLAAHLREHALLEGSPSPPSGGLTVKSFIPVMSALQQLELPANADAVLLTGSTLAQSDAVDRIAAVRDSIARHFGLNRLSNRGDEITINFAEIEPLDASLVVALEWSAGVLDPAPPAAEPDRGDTKKDLPVEPGNDPENHEQADTRTAGLNVTEAATYVGVSDKTMRDWIAGGTIDADSIEGTTRYRFPQHQLDTKKEIIEKTAARKK